MAKKPAKKSAATEAQAEAGDAPIKGRGKAKGAGGGGAEVNAEGKHLVIVESPTKAKTINQYLGKDYLVMASVGHVRDLPKRSPKGVKEEVPGVNLKKDFDPTYEILPEKKKTVSDLRKAAKGAADVWFATDLDREGEAIAWHLAQALEVPVDKAKRVVFNAITKSEVQHAFANPRPIDENRVNAQQARRILDRIVGYQVSPLLWKKVAGGLSAGRVQSVTVRVVVDREREIEAFIPEEYWKVTGYFTVDPARAADLGARWAAFLNEGIEAGNGAEQGEEASGNGKESKGKTQKAKAGWLAANRCFRAELVEFGGKSFEATERGGALAAAKALGFELETARDWEDENGKGPAKSRVLFVGGVGRPPGFAVRSIQTKRTTSRPLAPFITSTLQQAGANQLGFALKRTMQVAQQLYQGVDLKGALGQVGLITYMRTDSTHLSGEALAMARGYIEKQFGGDYLPEKPNFFASPNKSAQEAHEAIRPTDAAITPASIKGKLSEEQHRLYDLIWRRFVACQMTPAQWDSTTALIECKGGAGAGALFKATGRTLVFDGFYKVLGMPNGGDGDDAILPPLEEKQAVAPLQIDPTQHFTSPPARYTEASLQKKLEEEGIGRPSTYASIIQTIQDQKYVQQLIPGRDRRLCATDLGKVVTDKLIEGFPQIMDVAYTRQMETELDKIEEEHHDWVTMLREFYGPFKESLDAAHETMTHAKAELKPAPYQCGKCGAATVYRFGRNGRFLSCGRYPDCDYAMPVDVQGRPQVPEMSDVMCPLCGGGMTRRVGRFGAFLGCSNYPECKGILKLDPKKKTVVLPKPPPLLTDVLCPKCEAPLNLRRSKRGPWLSCSKFPKCRGRVAWSAVEEGKQAQLEAALSKHEAANPVPVVKNKAGQVVSDGYIPKIEGEEAVAGSAGGEVLEADAA